MPLLKSTSREATENNFHDLRHGKQFKRTAGKHGKKKARKQMIAAVLSNKRKAQGKKSRSKGRS